MLALLQQSQEREENTQQELQQSQERERLLSEQLKAERAQTANNAIMHTLNSLAVGPQSSITAATFHERYDDALTNSPFEAMIRGAVSSDQAIEEAWRTVQFYVQDLPDSQRTGSLTNRNELEQVYPVGNIALFCAVRSIPMSVLEGESNFAVWAEHPPQGFNQEAQVTSAGDAQTHVLCSMVDAGVFLMQTTNNNEWKGFNQNRWRHNLVIPVEYKDAPIRNVSHSKSCWICRFFEKFDLFQ